VPPRITLTVAEPDRTTRVRAFGEEQSASRFVVQNGRARDFALYEPHGSFSLKWIPRGAALYSVDRLRHRLSADDVLLLNAGQPYELEFLDRSGTESLCVFFSDPLVREAWSMNLAARPSQASLPEFPDIVFRAEPILATELAALRREISDPQMLPAQLEEQLLLLLERLIETSQDHRRLSDRVPAGKPRTRRMMLGQLQRARQLIEDTVGAMPTLDDLATASGLSKFHMLRAFKATFGSPPLKYAEACKVRRAMQLLKSTRQSIGDIAATVGYESQSAFTRSFARHTGVTPRTYRDAL
jgi:AraC family transcriptional regulator